MAEPSFAVNLGGSIYLDSEGRLLPGPPDNIPVYKPVDGFNFDVQPLKDSLKDFKGALPDLGDPKSVEKFTEMGFKPETIQALGKLAEIAGTAAAIATGVGIFIAVAKVFGALQGGDDAVTQLLKKEFDDLDRRLVNIEKKWDSRLAVGWRSAMEANLVLIDSYVREIQHAAPNPIGLEALLSAIRQRVGDAYKDLNVMTEAAIWETTFSQETYMDRQWLSIPGHLRFLNPDGSLVFVEPLPDGALRYDHRIPVPLTLYAVTTFVTMLRVHIPEFRSTGSYVEQLKGIAHNIDGQVRRMRTESLALTFYEADHMRDTSWCTTGMATAAPRSMYPAWEVTFAVGALDLCHHTSAFFDDLAVKSDAASRFLVGPLATMNFSWVSPAKLGRILPPGDFHPQKVIENPEECAAAANERSRIDYGELLVASGCTALIHLATLLRHLATEPDRSETVSGHISTKRFFETEMAATARSRDIFLKGVITSPARLRRFQYRANAKIMTQPLSRVGRLRYRVLLRTVDSMGMDDVWREPRYDPHVWTSQYIQDLTDPSFKRLQTTFNAKAVVGEAELASGFSPETLVQKQGHASLQAHTFDWYIPAPTPFLKGGTKARAKLLAKARGAGWSGPGRVVQQAAIPATGVTTRTRPVPLRSGPGVVWPLPDALFETGIWVDGVAGGRDWEGERRHVKSEPIEVDWNLTWNGEQLEIRVTSDPKYRSHEIYVVVEEELWSGEKLHTVLLAEMATQLMFVPEEFFTAEQEAVKHANEVLEDFEKRYAKSTPVGPRHPVIDQISMGRTLLRFRQADEAAAHQLMLAKTAETLRPDLLKKASKRELKDRER